MTALPTPPRARAPGPLDTGREMFAGRRWTVMVYMVADNDLDSQARADLAEMKAVGSTPEVTVVAQLDLARTDGPTRRYCLACGRSLEADAIGPPLGETNIGDARDLARFVAWAIEAYPADRYALVLWNHGIGWGDVDSGPEGVAGGGTGGPRVRRPIFRVMAGGILARGTAWDASSQDLECPLFRDNAEIKRALDAVLLLSGLDHLELLGLDACMMQMLETAYQFRGLARYVVASQEVERRGGWPYPTILRRLTSWPKADGAQLGAMVVDAYLRAAAPSEPVTLSALDLSRIDEVVSALNALCRCVLKDVAAARPFVLGAARAAQRYGDPDCCDLYDFCRLIWDHTAEMPLRAHARDLMLLLKPAGLGRFVVAEGHRGQRVERSHGVSIYFPAGGISPFYRRLDLFGDSLWGDMLRAVLRE